MQPLPIAITGLGLCSPLGDTLAATWDSLLAGQFITDHSRAVGDYSQPRVRALARKAAAAALRDSRWTTEETLEAALVVGTSKGPIESWLPNQNQENEIAPPSTQRARREIDAEKIAKSEFNLDSFSSSASSSALSAAKSSLQFGLAGIAADLNLTRGPRLTIATACASGLHALIRGAMLFGEGVDRVLVVAAESSLHPLFLGSFNRLGVLAPGEIGCRPFDVNRAGFLAGEAAAAVCLERKAGGIQIERFAMAADATDLIRGDEQGRMVRRLLTTVIDSRPVDLIHAHGTGTVTNDAAELAAIQSTATANEPALYSHKAALGHTLGAAGLISVVLNCQCHKHAVIPGNVRTAHPLPMNGLRFSQSVLERRVSRSVVIASGFGGAGAAVTLCS